MQHNGYKQTTYAGSSYAKCYGDAVIALLWK